MTKYISHAETNKLIRETLKVEFPGVKFKVKIQGGITHINYEAPILAKDVTAVVSIFEGRSFDGMQDLATPNFVYTEGEEIHYGADYISVSRHISIEEQIQYADYLIKHYSWQDTKGNRVEHPGYTIKTTKYGERMEADWNIIFGNYGNDLLQMVHKMSQEHTSFADFKAVKEQEVADMLARQVEYEAKHTQEQKWEQALEIAIVTVETKVTVNAEPAIDEYEEMLIAAGWVTAA